MNPSSLSPNTQGICWAFLATGCFTLVLAMAKVAIEDYHVLQILFFRQIVVFLSSLPSLIKSFPAGLKTKRPGVHVCRLLGAFVALSFSIWAVAELPLTTAMTLGFAQAFFVALLAMHILGEHIGPHRIGAVLMGFVGVVIVMRPGVEGMLDSHALIPIGAALGAAVAITSVRHLSQTESTATLLLYQAVFVGTLAGIPLFWHWKTPDFNGLMLLLAMGVIAAIGQWVGVRSLRLGEASVVANVQYMQLVYAAILGYFLFDEIPDRYVMAGAALIVGSSIYLLHRERLARSMRSR